MLPSACYTRSQVSPRLPVIKEPVVKQVIPIYGLVADPSNNLAEDDEGVAFLVVRGEQDAINDPLGRQFAADYQYYALRLQLQGGELIDYSRDGLANALKNLYAGAGVGIIYDNITSINRYSVQYPGYYTPGLDKASQIFIPFRIGYEFKFFNRYQRPDINLDIGYQYNMVLGDELDGFKAGHLNDAYTQFTIGVKFSLGEVTSYRKQINF